MSYLKIRKIKRLYFGYNEVAQISGITKNSARVACTRMVKKGLLVRLKRDLYVLEEKWNNMSKEDKFIIANILQVPSYVSLMTALDYYGVTTQMQRDFVESICIYRTKEIKIKETVFNYTKIKKELYAGFVKENGFFIATKERAFLDAVYLFSLGKYNFDLTSIDYGKLDKSVLNEMLKCYPTYTQKRTLEILKNYEYIRKT